MIRESKVTLTLNQPADVGIFILDLNKVLMYEFHYNYVKNKYGNNSRLLFTDSDSLVCEIKTGNTYEDFNKEKKILDFSNYSIKSKFYNHPNKLVAFKIKDETAGVAIKKFVWLKPKNY